MSATVLDNALHDLENAQRVRARNAQEAIARRERLEELGQAVYTTAPVELRQSLHRVELAKEEQQDACEQRARELYDMTEAELKRRFYDHGTMTRTAFDQEVKAAHDLWQARRLDLARRYGWVDYQSVLDEAMIAVHVAATAAVAADWAGRSPGILARFTMPDPPAWAAQPDPEPDPEPQSGQGGAPSAPPVAARVKPPRRRSAPAQPPKAGRQAAR